MKMGTEKQFSPSLLLHGGMVLKSGVLVIDKPEGMTSFDVVAKVRKTLGTKKVGHTGTLDPLATGVLVICVGQATKLVDFLTCDSKIHDVEMQLGVETNTGDITGDVVKREKEIVVDVCQLEAVMESFIGKQQQIPPMYSAIKVNGQKLYELARKGITVDRKPRDIEIFSITNVLVATEEGRTLIRYRVHCSKGTYVRSLCEDIAKRLGTCGTMSRLRRVQSGQFLVQNAITLEELEEEKMISIEKLFDKKIDVKKYVKQLINGEKIKVDLEDGYYKLYADEFLGIGVVSRNFLKREIILQEK